MIATTARDIHSFRARTSGLLAHVPSPRTYNPLSSVSVDAQHRGFSPVKLSRHGEGYRFPRHLLPYGFWLPNDERGSGSDFVRSDALTKFGPANPVSHGRSVAKKAFDFEIRELARASLRYPPVVFTDAQLASIARGFEKEMNAFNPAPILAWSNMRNHFHFVSGRCRYDIRRFAGRLKGAATKQLIADGLHPFQKFAEADGTIPSPWSVKPWIVYLFDDDDILRSIRYVQSNPIKAGLAPQVFPFVLPFKGRTPGAAHRR